jgi:DNA invertase Pin-like site-specific DNA recombinase
LKSKTAKRNKTRNLYRMTFGYIRVSKTIQNYDLQADAMKDQHCDKLFFEKESGVKYREQWNTLYEQLRDGDTVIVWRIDRLGRTAWEMIKLMAELSERSIRFISIKEGIDTSTPMGKIWFSMNAIMAENERIVLIDRSGSGLIAARVRGRIGGRPKGLSAESERKMKAVKKLYASQVSISEIRKTLDIASNATVYKYIHYKPSAASKKGTDKNKAG